MELPVSYTEAENAVFKSSDAHTVTSGQSFSGGSHTMRKLMKPPEPV